MGLSKQFVKGQSEGDSVASSLWLTTNSIRASVPPLFFFKSKSVCNQCFMKAMEYCKGRVQQALLRQNMQATFLTDCPLNTGDGKQVSSATTLFEGDL